MYDVLTHAWLVVDLVLEKLGHDTGDLDLLTSVLLARLHIARRQLRTVGASPRYHPVTKSRPDDPDGSSHRASSRALA